MGDSSDDRVSYLHAREPSVDRRRRPCPMKQETLFNQISEEDSSSETASNSSLNSTGTATTDASAGNTTNNAASVYLRLRPDQKNCTLYTAENNIFKTKISCDPNQPAKSTFEKLFTFTDVFNSDVSQAAVYDACVYAAIENVENLTVLTYGTSGSGKTFTILGDNAKPGIIPRAIHHIFTKHANKICSKPVIKIDKGAVVVLEDHKILLEELHRKKLLADKAGPSINVELETARISAEHNFKLNSEGNQDYVVVWISFAEIYNECVYDLLNTSTEGQQKENIGASKVRKNLKVISNDGNAFVKELTSVNVRNSVEALQLLTNGRARVSYASTNINKNSSRSHCIFFVDILQFLSTNEFSHTSYKFCDLAGSERLKKTDNIGSRLKEAQNINTSLMVLGRCLDAVYNNHSIVPFRESKLTVLLQAPLMGKEKITMIVNLSPIVDFFEENLNVLQFASMARRIVFKPPPAPKKPRCSGRFSWFMGLAPVGSPNNDRQGNGNENSLLLDENERLKLNNDLLLQDLVSLKQQLGEQEVDIRRQIIQEFEERSKRSNVLWQKRLDHKEEYLKEKVAFEVSCVRRDLQSDIRSLREDIEDMKNEHEQEIAALQNEHVMKQSKLKAETVELKAEIVELRADIVELKAENCNLKVNFKNENMEHLAKNFELQKKIDELTENAKKDEIMKGVLVIDGEIPAKRRRLSF